MLVIILLYLSADDQEAIWPWCCLDNTSEKKVGKSDTCHRQQHTWTLGSSERVNYSRKLFWNCLGKQAWRASAFRILPRVPPSIVLRFTPISLISMHSWIPLFVSNFR